MNHPVKRIVAKISNYFEKRRIRKTARKVLNYFDKNNINEIEDLRAVAYEERIPGKPWGYTQLTTKNLQINLDFGLYELTNREKVIAYGYTGQIPFIKEELAELAEAA